MVRMSPADQENGQSRIFFGIHWVFDKTEGDRPGARGRRLRLEGAFQPEP